MIIVGQRKISLGFSSDGLRFGQSGPSLGGEQVKGTKIWEHGTPNLL